jgi:predicted nucleotidyltransferase
MHLPEAWVRGIQEWAEQNASIQEVWLFGSRARVEAPKKGSDVDLAFQLTPPTKSGTLTATDWALANFMDRDTRRAWKAELECIVGCDVDLELISPETEPRMLIWRRDGQA